MIQRVGDFCEPPQDIVIVCGHPVQWIGDCLDLIVAGVIRERRCVTAEIGDRTDSAGGIVGEVFMEILGIDDFRRPSGGVVMVLSDGGGQGAGAIGIGAGDLRRASRRVVLERGSLYVPVPFFRA